MNQVNQKPIVLETPPPQQVPGVKLNVQTPTKETSSAIRQIVCSKKVGEKWEIKFLGPVARRDVNRILVTIRVAFARQKRKQRLNKMTEERKLLSTNPLRAAQLESGENGKQ